MGFGATIESLVVKNGLGKSDQIKSPAPLKLPLCTCGRAKNLPRKPDCRFIDRLTTQLYAPYLRP